MATLHVERYSFFPSPEGGSLRFSEIAPQHDHSESDRQLCGCTKTVATRPEGKPEQVSQVLTLKNEDPQWSFVLADPWLIFGGMGRDPHAYFMMGHDNRMDVEIHLPGYGNVDYFFGHVFLGNQVDTSRLMNGHSPSRIIKLSEIAPDQLWAHVCHWGKEAVEFFPERSDETSMLRHVLRRAESLKRQVRPYADDLSTPVEVLREKLAAEKDLLGGADAIKTALEPYFQNLRGSMLFQVCDKIEQATLEQLPPRRARE